MIFEHKEKLDEIMPYLPIRLAKGLAFLRDTDFSNMEDGRYEIEGNDVYATISTYKTSKKTDLRPEIHFKYIDIQYLIAGKEVICCVPYDKNILPVEKNLEKDIAFFDKNIANEREYILREKQDVIIIFPWETHKPCCFFESHSNKVKKLVIKVKINE